MSTDPGPIAFRGVRLFLRAIQLLCAAIILSIFSYFLAALSNHALPTPNWVRAVEGIVGIAVGYAGLHFAILIFFPRAAVPRPFSSLVTMVLDGSFAVAFIYVAAANRGGSGSCTGIVSTPFGEGDADTGKKVESGAQGGFTTLPSLRQACQLETACLAVAVIALFFFIFSILAEVALIRHQRKGRQQEQPLNGFVGAGYSAPTEQQQQISPPRRGFWASLFGRRKRDAAGGVGPGTNPNALPEHATPNDYRSSYATEHTRVGTAQDGNSGPKYEYESLEYGGHDISDNHIGNEPRWDDVPLAQYPPANYRYSDGVYDRV